MTKKRKGEKIESLNVKSTLDLFINPTNNIIIQKFVCLFEYIMYVPFSHENS